MQKRKNKTKYNRLLTKVTFINNLVLLKDAAGMSHAEFDSVLGLTKNAFSVIANNCSISPKRMEHIAAAIGVSVDELASPTYTVNIKDNAAKFLATIKARAEQGVEPATYHQGRLPDIDIGIEPPIGGTAEAKAMGKRLKLYRVDCGFTQREFTEFIGISPATYSRTETGSHTAKQSVIKAIADATGLSIDFILHGNP